MTNPTVGDPIEIVIEKLLRTYAGWRRGTSVETMRADWDALFPCDPSLATSESQSIAGVECQWITAPSATRDRMFVYLHGGGYLVGSPRSHFDLIARISAASGAAGLAIDYRLAPEHKFPAAIEDVVAVGDWLASHGTTSKIAFVGDSAGGNLALAAALALRDKGGLRPSAMVLLSPWTDMELRGESYESRRERDPIHKRQMLGVNAGNYLGDANPADPLASPLNADLAGLPPMLIQVGEREIIFDDSSELAIRANAAGVNARLEEWDGMIHVFQQFAEELPQAREAIARIGAFLSEHLA